MSAPSAIAWGGDALVTFCACLEPVAGLSWRRGCRVRVSGGFLAPMHRRKVAGEPGRKPEGRHLAARPPRRSAERGGS
jgi:hypothetical protein